MPVSLIILLYFWGSLMKTVRDKVMRCVIKHYRMYHTGATVSDIVEFEQIDDYKDVEQNLKELTTDGCVREKHSELYSGEIIYYPTEVEW